MNKGMKIGLVVVGLIVITVVVAYMLKKRKTKTGATSANLKLGKADKAVASKEISPLAKN